MENLFKKILLATSLTILPAQSLDTKIDYNKTEIQKNIFDFSKLAFFGKSMNEVAFVKAYEEAEKLKGIYILNSGLKIIVKDSWAFNNNSEFWALRMKFKIIRDKKESKILTYNFKYNLETKQILTEKELDNGYYFDAKYDSIIKNIIKTKFK